MYESPEPYRAIAKSPAPGDAATRLLHLVDTLQAEIHPGAVIQSCLDSSLDRDLGFDSLTRSELLLRIEEAFSVRLGDEVLGEIETPGHLLKAVRLAQEHAAALSRRPSSAGETPVPPPPLTDAGADRLATAGTLLDVLAWHAAQQPEVEHIRHLSGDGQSESISFGGLWRNAHELARGLVVAGLQPGETVALMLPTSLQFFEAFCGIMVAGGVPVALYPPVRLTQIEDHMRRQAGILASCQAPILITVPEAATLAQLLRMQVGSLRRIATVSELRQSGATEPATQLPALSSEANATALLQYTSGSTGNPKGVIVSHANLLSNIRAYSEAVGFTAADICVSWLPLYHDMGLIGAWMGSLFNGSRLILMSPTSFLASPEEWLWNIHRHGATISAAPNFAYELCLRRLAHAPNRFAGLDLSRWRIAANGAEPVNADTIERFCEAFAPFGFPATSLLPMYGLAECTLGLTIPPRGRPARIDVISATALRDQALATPAVAGDRNSQRLVACGRALPGLAIRIVNDANEDLPERHIGHIEFRGRSASAGYFRNQQATHQLRHGDWSDTGDLGYLADGELFVTGRVKDLIIRGGRNLYPEQLEDAIGRIDGVRRGGVAIFGTTDPATASERLVAVVETRHAQPQNPDQLRQRIRQLAVDILGTPIDEIVLAPAHSVLKTSSGKLRRSATRDAWLAGSLGKAAGAPWRQILRLGASAALSSLGDQTKRLAQLAYGAYAWSLFFVMAIPVWLLVALPAKPRWGWAVCHYAGRLLIWLSGNSIAIGGNLQLPDRGAFVVVMNHTSYVDGFFLTALINRPCAVVAKREFSRQFFVGRFLRGMGVRYVDRLPGTIGGNGGNGSNGGNGGNGSVHLAMAAQNGRPLVFFPEGTFTGERGLHPFRLGAFVVAANAGVPVIPVAIQGSREILRDGSWLPHAGRVTLTVGAPIPPSATPDGHTWSAALALRDAARAHILRHCGEPDLPR